MARITKKSIAIKVALVLALLAAIIAPAVLPPETGREPDEKGWVSFNGWDVIPNDLECVAGIMYGGGNVMLSLILDKDKTEYSLAIQSKDWGFPEEYFGAAIVATLKFEENIQELDTNAVIDSVDRIYMKIPRNQIGLLTPRNNNMLMVTLAGRTIVFETGPLTEVVQELNYCINRLDEPTVNP